MIITPTGLTRAAGVSAAVAGSLFIAVQINHPVIDVATVDTAEWVLRSSAKAVMAALALAGITGMYLRQVRQMGVLGLLGYLLFSVGYLIMFSVAVIAAAVLPQLTDAVPALVDDIVVAAVGGTPVGDIGGIQNVFNLSGIGYMLGGLLFGIALFRARVLARTASALLAVATISTVSLAFLPESFNRPMAVPTGLALIGLGVSLWRSERIADVDVTPAPLAAAPVPVR